MWPFKKRKQTDDESASIWKNTFYDCVAADYLPTYSVCLCEDHQQCRHVARYAGMLLCGHPEHKTFIPDGAEPFNPHKNQFRD